MEAFTWIAANWQEALINVQALLTAIIAIALMCPGEQPEKALQKVVSIMSKISKK